MLVQMCYVATNMVGVSLKRDSSSRSLVLQQNFCKAPQCEFQDLLEFLDFVLQEGILEQVL
jgi:hypothetical protein